MNATTKCIVSLVIAAIAAALSNVLLNDNHIDQRLLFLFVLFFVATATTAMIVGKGGATIDSRAEQSSWTPASGDASREQGTVKWFNVSKGFGFIVKSDGEEIFVHFRSIRGEGRRGLRDGQSVSFIVAQSDKGPQAEDVLPQD